MKKVLLVLALFTAFLAYNCSGTKELPKTSEGEIPGWFSNPPKDPNFLFEVNTATSRDMQLAVDNAKMGASAGIARKLELKLSDLQKRFVEEIGKEANSSTFLSQFTQATKTVTSMTLNGISVKEQKLVKDGSNWRAYVLVEYPMGAANQSLVDQLKKNKELYTRFRASQAFEELDKDTQNKAENQP